jgi:hypothetical protein
MWLMSPIIYSALIRMGLHRCSTVVFVYGEFVSRVYCSIEKSLFGDVAPLHNMRCERRYLRLGPRANSIHRVSNVEFDMWTSDANVRNYAIWELKHAAEGAGLGAMDATTGIFSWTLTRPTRTLKWALHGIGNAFLAWFGFRSPATLV